MVLVRRVRGYPYSDEADDVRDTVKERVKAVGHHPERAREVSPHDLCHRDDLVQYEGDYQYLSDPGRVVGYRVSVSVTIVSLHFSLNSSKLSSSTAFRIFLKNSR